MTPRPRTTQTTLATQRPSGPWCSGSWVVVVLLAILARGAAAQTDVEITLETLGLSGALQPGTWTPARVSVRSELPDTIAALLSFECTNGDGDVERFTRPIVLAPGQQVTRWVYPHLPPRASALSLQGEVFTIRVYENNNGVPGRELGMAPVSGASATQTGTPIEMTQSPLLIVGTGDLGLRAYQLSPSNSNLVPSLNERTMIVNIAPEALPDRARGYAAYPQVVWSDSSPQALGADQAEALKEFVRRGGRLVIVLPESGDLWGIGSGSRTRLDDLLPPQAPRVFENVPIASILQSVSKSPTLRNPDATMSIRCFELDAWNDTEQPWEPLAAFPAPISGPRAEKPLEGAVYAAQRRFGHGWVVVLGLDAHALSRRQLQAGGLPQADVFWNRILARRGTVPGIEALRAYERTKTLRLSPDRFGLGRGAWVLEHIRIGGASAGLAMFVALGLFIFYWVLSGPGGFALLKRQGKVRYAWLGFTLVAIVMSGVTFLFAWGGRALLGREAPVRHLTFLDVIDGEPHARATSFFSAYLPDYGATQVMIEGDNNLLSTWSPPPSGTLERFPDSDVVQMPTDSPNGFSIPARATSAHFLAQWQGKLQSPWNKMPAPQETPIAYTTQMGITARNFSSEGIVRHGLPWTLQSVQVMQIGPYRSATPSWITTNGLSREHPIDALPNPGVFGALPQGLWAPGETLALSGPLAGPHTIGPNGVTSDFSLQRQLDLLYGATVRTTIRSAIGMEGSWRSLDQELLQMYGIFRMLPQPVSLLNTPGTSNNTAAIHYQRWLARDVDQSDWFIRPCLIVTAVIKDAPLPMELTIAGEQVESSGTVVLRWIKPLPVETALVAPVPRTLHKFQAPPPEDPEG